MHRVGYVLSDSFQMMALGTQAVFEFANQLVGSEYYRVQVYAPGGGPVRSSIGTAVATEALTARTPADTWMIPGLYDPTTTPADPAVLDFLAGRAQRARRIAGLCTGGFMLAEAGLLDGRRATTHWIYADAMRERFPGVLIEPDRIFVTDGPMWTSAGMTAGLDLALGLVEKDLGSDITRALAHRLVMPHRRSGGQTQHSEMLMLAPRSDRIQDTLDYARRNLSQALGVDELAAVAHLSPRQFSRVFTAETGESPARAVEKLRLEAARTMIEQSRHSLEVVARETGFRDRRHLREVFLRGYGIPPQAVRRTARA
ncbi:GlxA family transcriptional regulator [Luteibacter yeojuensis]|uniref:AraC family transcriptional regulator n=1 Tax=Luteibacter yeojuensis TaxID=345309 RepID=A0A0F3KXQ9_9GAMM|nr:GlxA family transcriptional regulator [Luteibacter yeojuensis]KJV35737.1 AraC family transcriptional regulator [Luteibacter yeojuensis]